MKILIVDDEISISRLLSKVFAADGHQTLSANSAEEALEITKKVPVDLAFVDLCLPGLNGVEAVRLMKKNNAKTRFIIITGFGDMTSVKKATELGVFDYVTKPFDLDYLRSLVKHIQSCYLKPLPYTEHMDKFFSGELTPEEVKQEKEISFKEEIKERFKSLKGIEGVPGGYYLGNNNFSFRHKGMLRKIRKITHNFYFIVTAVGILVGSIFGYIYAKINSSKLYGGYYSDKKVSISDFYKTLNELKYWMQKHTEQGIALEQDQKFR
ncbi:MAG: response regulator [Candidatus Omnitrophica bacterium]|nr:response regulator [Candidatus Omnitrophota bacterium]MDD5429295.1 response regulator [Candidatus Omnitrophota bacterium]